LRKKTGRKLGGQPGRAGRTLEQVSDLDEVIRHEPTYPGFPKTVEASGDRVAAGVSAPDRDTSWRRAGSVRVQAKLVLR